MVAFGFYWRNNTAFEGIYTQIVMHKTHLPNVLESLDSGRLSSLPIEATIRGGHPDCWSLDEPLVKITPSVAPFSVCGLEHIANVLAAEVNPDIFRSRIRYPSPILPRGKEFTE